MYKVLTLNKISKFGLNELPTDLYSVSDNETNPDAILLRSFKMHDMELPDSLMAVARCGAGVNNIPLEKCAEKGIVVFNTPGANANAVKELVLTALLISSRKIIDSYNWTQALTENVSANVEKGKSQFQGPEIKGKTLGVVGLGAIGALSANAAASLGMKVIGYDPYLSVKGALHLRTDVKYTKNLDEIFKECDYITVHVPLTDDTKEMFRKENFDKVKKGVRIINLARGELVNNQDMKEAIKNGIVSCYVTDFPNEELLGTENIITLPHLGASTPEAEDNCAVMAAEELREYMEYGNIVNSVNYPNCSLSYTGKKRLSVLHKNEPNVVASITSALGKDGINIDNMVNKSRNEYSCTIVDIDSDFNDNIISALKQVSGVIKLRVIG